MIEGALFLTEADLADVAALARRILTEEGYDPSSDEEPALGMVERAIAWGRRLELYKPGQRICRVCGCTEHNACVDEVGQACAWGGPDLCTACAPFVEGGV